MSALRSTSARASSSRLPISNVTSRAKCSRRCRRIEAAILRTMRRSLRGLRLQSSRNTVFARARISPTCASSCSANSCSTRPLAGLIVRYFMYSSFVNLFFSDIGDGAQTLPRAAYGGALSLQFPLKELGLAEAEAPVGFCIRYKRDHQIVWFDPALTFELFAQSFVEGLLKRVASVDAADGYQDDVLAPFDTKASVLDNQFVRGVLMHDLITVARRDSQCSNHGIVRGIEQAGDGFFIPSFDQVKTQ